MKLYQKRIKEYKELIQGQYVKDDAINETIIRCNGIIEKQRDVKTSYFEFLYEQSAFIKKRWWIFQGIVLCVLWLLLMDSDNAEYMGRIMGTLATVFAMLIIPEFWKNRRNSAMEIEMASYYSLRQICSARILLFAMADFMMITAFFAVAFHTVQISIYNMMINFMIPFNVSCCICFRVLYSKWIESEYIAVFASMAWIVLWLVAVTQDSIYHFIAEPVWLGLVLLSSAYLVFLARKSNMDCEKSLGGIC